MNNMTAGIYHYRLIDGLGQTIMVGTIMHPGGNATDNIATSPSLAKGAYHLEIIEPDNTQVTISLIN